MKTIKIISILLAVLSFQNSIAEISKGGKEKVVIQTSAICESCQNRIQKALINLDGVKSASLNLDDKKVTVVYNPEKVTVEQIKKTISEAGYDADEVKANPDAYKNLPGCCKKENEDEHNH